jgi:hypothetical protein
MRPFRTLGDVRHPAQVPLPVAIVIGRDELPVGERGHASRLGVLVAVRFADLDRHRDRPA